MPGAVDSLIRRFGVGSRRTCRAVSIPVSGWDCSGKRDGLRGIFRGVAEGDREWWVWYSIRPRYIGWGSPVVVVTLNGSRSEGTTGQDYSRYHSSRTTASELEAHPLYTYIVSSSHALHLGIASHHSITRTSTQHNGDNRSLAPAHLRNGQR